MSNNEIQKSTEKKTNINQFPCTQRCFSTKKSRNTFFLLHTIPSWLPFLPAWPARQQLWQPLLLPLSLRIELLSQHGPLKHYWILIIFHCQNDLFILLNTRYKHQQPKKFLKSIYELHPSESGIFHHLSGNRITNKQTWKCLPLNCNSLEQGLTHNKWSMIK